MKSQFPGLLQALIQYPDGTSATNAMNALEGHAIYDGGYNKVLLSPLLYYAA